MSVYFYVWVYHYTKSFDLNERFSCGIMSDTDNKSLHWFDIIQACPLFSLDLYLQAWINNIMNINIYESSVVFIEFILSHQSLRVIRPPQICSSTFLVVE